MKKKRPTRVRDVMTTAVYVCRADDTLEQAARLLWERDCGCLPVVDPDGAVLAMITDRDICMAAYTQGLSLREIQVADAMSNGVLRCQEHDLLADVAEEMGNRGVRRLPVTDKIGRIVGILSVNDMVCACSKAHVDGASEDLLLASVLEVLIGASKHRGGRQDTTVSKTSWKDQAVEVTTSCARGAEDSSDEVQGN